MKRTFSGIDISLFANEPKPSELAGIVADMTSEETAEFFCLLAEQMGNRNGALNRHAIKNIADDLCELEEKLCDGGGSRLLRLLASSLKEHA